MPPRRSHPPSEQTTALSQGGCLSGFAIPPLAVLCVSGLLAFVWLGSMTSSAPAAAADPVQVNLAVPPDAGPLSPVFPPEVQYWNGPIHAWAAAAGLDPNLVATVMQIESCGDPRARSGAGAMGLFQVMPYHFTGADDPYDPDTNALRGLAYLKRSLEAANGDVRLALAGYNGGIGVIGRSELSWAGETQRYAYWGSGIYDEATNGVTVSLRLEEWMVTSGASLCRQAHDRLGVNP